jgi:hypothetical protein
VRVAARHAAWKNLVQPGHIPADLQNVRRVLMCGLDTEAACGIWRESLPISLSGRCDLVKSLKEDVGQWQDRRILIPFVRKNTLKSVRLQI